ncbi:MAG TPA: hypothetical protein VHC19_01295 [Pirellulales bacterium]|nr:hypothetical protein [Pirellulales bacterium]
MTELSARVERLERMNRLLWGLLLAGAAIGIGAGFRARQDVVQAREFQLVDENGQQAGLWRSGDEGKIDFLLGPFGGDSKQGSVLAMTVENEGAAIGLKRGSSPRVFIGSTRLGGYIDVKNDDGKSTWSSAELTEK